MGAIEGHLRHRQLQQQVYFVSGTRLGIPKTDTDTALVLHTRIHTHTHEHARARTQYTRKPSNTAATGNQTVQHVQTAS